MSTLKDAVAGQVIREAIDLGARLTEKVVALNSAATTTLDTRLGNVFEIALGANITTLSITNVPASGKSYSMLLKLKQGAAGNYSVSFPGTVKWPNGSAPILTATANKYDQIILSTQDGGTTWTGTVGSQNH